MIILITANANAYDMNLILIFFFLVYNCLSKINLFVSLFLFNSEFIIIYVFFNQSVVMTFI